MQTVTVWTGVQWSWAPSYHSNSSSRPIRCRIKAGAAIKRWVHRRHCCVRGQQSATSPAGICCCWSHRESHLTTASTAEACLPTVWSSPNVHVTELQASEMEVMRCWKNIYLNPHQVFWLLVLFLTEYVCSIITAPMCDATKLNIKSNYFWTSN